MAKLKGKLFGDLKSIKWQNFIGLTFAGIVNAIGVTLFLAPMQLIDSGFSGTSLLLARYLPFLGLSFFLVVFNFPFFLFGLKKQGLTFTIYSLYAIAVYSIAAFIIQRVLPINLSNGSPVAQTDILLCALFGGLISGAGSGLTIRFGGAIDGVEVMAVIFARTIGITIGTFVMLYNAVLYIITGFVTGDWLIPLYSVVAYAIGNKSVDFVVDGLDKAKAALIITNNGSQIAERLSVELKRGITMLDARGYYSKEEKTILYCVVNRFQIAKLKKLVAETDPMAFVTITDISDTLGTSLKFSLRRKKKAANAPTVTLSQNPPKLFLSSQLGGVQALTEQQAANSTLTAVDDLTQSTDAITFKQGSIPPTANCLTPTASLKAEQRKDEEEKIDKMTEKSTKD